MIVDVGAVGTRLLNVPPHYDSIFERDAVPETISACLRVLPGFAASGFENLLVGVSRNPDLDNYTSVTHPEKHVEQYFSKIL